MTPYDQLTPGQRDDEFDITNEYASLFRATLRAMASEEPDIHIAQMIAATRVLRSLYAGLTHTPDPNRLLADAVNQVTPSWGDLKDRDLHRLILARSCLRWTAAKSDTVARGVVRHPLMLDEEEDLLDEALEMAFREIEDR
jgi:hypothetical protein